MKKISFAGLFIVLFVLACRKETPVVFKEGVSAGNSTCSNGVMDEGEDNVDCGVNCTPCLMSHPDCFETLESNKVSFSYSSTDNFDFSSAVITSEVVSGKLRIIADNGTNILKATFMLESPDPFRSYDIDQYPSTSDEVKLEITDNFGNNFVGYSEKLHLNREGGKYTLEFCSVYMNSFSLSGYAVLTGRIVSSN